MMRTKEITKKNNYFIRYSLQEIWTMSGSTEMINDIYSMYTQ